MQFSNPTTGSGICEDVDWLASSDLNTYPINKKVVSANRALDKVFTLIIGSDGRWQFDDENITTLPIATTPLVANQQDYGFDTRFLVLTRVEVQNPNGTWSFLIPFDQNDLAFQSDPIYPFTTNNVVGSKPSLTDFMKTPGTPQYYDKIGNSVFVYPPPNYSTQTSGANIGQPALIKAYFQRKLDYFVPTDTVKQPGFAEPFHRYISFSMVYDYQMSKGLVAVLKNGKIASPTLNAITAMESDIKTFYAYREKDKTHRLQMATRVKR